MPLDASWIHGGAGSSIRLRRSVMIHLISRSHARLLVAIAAAVLGALAPLSASFAAGPQQVTMRATEFSFTPDAVTLTVGQPVQITIVNGGKVDHDLKSDLP